MPKDRKGWVYVLSNPSMPGVVKIGYTERSVDARMEDLNSTEVPTPFEKKYEALCLNAKRVESKAHSMMNSVRVSEKREFFECTAAYAVEKIRKAADEIGEKIIHEELFDVGGKANSKSLKYWDSIRKRAPADQSLNYWDSTGKKAPSPEEKPKSNSIGKMEVRINVFPETISSESGRGDYLLDNGKRGFWHLCSYGLNQSTDVMIEGNLAPTEREIVFKELKKIISNDPVLGRMFSGRLRY